MTTNPPTSLNISHYLLERKLLWTLDQAQAIHPLYWQGEAIPRDSERYQELLDKAFNALAENSSFRRALLATQNATLTHNMGKKKISETVLTKNEFTSRLTAIRTRLQNEKD